MGRPNLISTQVRAAELFPRQSPREKKARTAAHEGPSRLRPERPRGAADPRLLSRAVRVRGKSRLAIDATLCDAGKYTKKLKNLAAEAKKRAHDEKVAEKNRAAEEAKAKAEQEKLFQEAQARRAAVAKADRAHLQASHAV